MMDILVLILIDRNFKECWKYIKNKKIDIIIIKDLSRLGRNYIETDNYIENILPGYNVRFISIIDDVDSFKNPKDKHKFIIDKETAYIVNKIFNMIRLGKSRKEIAEHLNNKNVLTPSLYKLSKENINNEDLIRSKKWNSEIVNRILRNETYTGTLIQNIKTKPNYRTDKLIDVNKDEWIITENHHESIISKDKFDDVQQILNGKTKVNKNDDIDLFSGYLKCSHCGSSLIIKRSKNQIYYYCGSYIKDKSCLKYSINKKKLEQMVKDEIIKKINIEKLDRKVLNELIDMIYNIDKNNIKTKFKIYGIINNEIKGVELYE